MRIKIWASAKPEFPNTGPYKKLDLIERERPYSLGDMTHYGQVIDLPPFGAFDDDDSDLSVIVKLDPASLSVRPAESVLEWPPSSFDKIQLFPILVDPFPAPGDSPPPEKNCVILETENISHSAAMLGWHVGQVNEREANRLCKRFRLGRTQL